MEKSQNQVWKDFQRYLQVSSQILDFTKKKSTVDTILGNTVHV